ncbi:MAG: phosphotransferase family protein [Rhodospirillaceae bacterium]|mgnify:CR=1 FL=1|nr:phosphotransferase family protein [Rhodospirillaceae bacterium]|tara:strand:+ start:914 stop:1963 length:1050 start_codon:yes stop_codon:yes gene_type:complete
MTNLIAVSKTHRFDERRLSEYLSSVGLAGFDADIIVQQFQGGQSNPTFCIETNKKSYVLRKKPPGKLLPSAHLVEREYKIMEALAKTDVPVPKMHHLCEDPNIIGTSFFIMDYLDGRVIDDTSLPGNFSSIDREAIFDSMNKALAALHNVDFKAIGLADYGKPKNYIVRQIDRWTRQFEATKTDPMPSMDALIKWLPENRPTRDEVSITHGDFRMGNLILHPSKPEVIAVLDWELSTLGHPFADLAYNCMPYSLPCDGTSLNGLVGLRFEEQGIPSQEDYVASYADRTGRKSIPNFKFFLAFSCFRLASICQGVYARGLQGNASSENAIEVGAKAPRLADIGWEIAQML